jgi:hypothetical protein
MESTLFALIVRIDCRASSFLAEMNCPKKSYITLDCYHLKQALTRLESEHFLCYQARNQTRTLPSGRGPQRTGDRTQAHAGLCVIL